MSTHNILLTDNTKPKQRGKPFSKGQSGNPQGRPRGALNRSTLAALALMEGQLEAITQAAIDAALAGDLTAIKLVLDRILPQRRELPISLPELPVVVEAADVPKLTAAVLDAVARGDITATEGEKLSALAVAHAKALELYELEKRVAVLEGKDNA